MVRGIALCALAVWACAPLRSETFLALPFFNISRNANVDWIGESLAETIRESLVGQGLIALNRDDRQEAYRRLSLRPYAQLTRASVLKLAEALDADRVVFGSFQLTPAEAGASSRGTLRITAQILDMRKLTQGREFSESGPLEDLAKLQSHLAWQTLQVALPKSPPSEQEFRMRTPLVRVDAIENYIRGLVATSPEQKLKLFSQAVRLDPRYSQAHFGIGRIQFERKNYKLAAEYLAKVATEDVHYREGSFYLGICRHHLGDFAGAEQVFQTVAQAVPINEVLNNLAAAQLRQSHFVDALENFRKALEGDSTDPDYHFNVGFTLFKLGKLSEAADSFRAVLDRNREDAEAITMLGRSLKRPKAAVRTEFAERLKYSYEESAWLQLKSMVEPKK